MEPPSSDYDVFVKTLTGRVIAVNVSSSDTVHILKLKIHDKVGIEPAAQRYVFQAKQLSDDQSLWAAGVRKESIVNLIVRADIVPQQPQQQQQQEPQPSSATSGSHHRRRRPHKAAPAAPQDPVAWAVQPQRHPFILVFLWLGNAFLWVDRCILLPISTFIANRFRNLMYFIRTYIAPVVRTVYRPLSRVMSQLWEVLRPVLRFVLITLPRHVFYTIPRFVLYTAPRFLLYDIPKYIVTRDLFVTYCGTFIQRLSTVVRGTLVVLRELLIATCRFFFYRLPYRIVYRRMLAPLWRSVLHPLLQLVFVRTPRAFSRGVASSSRFLYNHALRPTWQHVISPLMRAVFVSTPRSLHNYVFSPVWRHALFPTLCFVFYRFPLFIDRQLCRFDDWLTDTIARPLLRVLFVTPSRYISQNLLPPIGRSLSRVANAVYTHALVPAARSTNSAVRSMLRFVHTYGLRPVFYNMLWLHVLTPFHTFVLSPAFRRLLLPLLHRSVFYLYRVYRFVFPISGLSSHGYDVAVRPGRFMLPNLVVMQDRSLYNIHVNNNTYVRTDCVISIDGKEMGRFRLEPHCRYVITRPVNESARFEFRADNAVRANAAQLRDPAAAAQFGSIVSVAFFPQVFSRQRRHQKESTTSSLNSRDKRSGGSCIAGEEHDDDGAPAREGGGGAEFVSGGTVLSGRAEQLLFANYDAIETSPHPIVTLQLRLVGQAPPQA